MTDKDRWAAENRKNVYLAFGVAEDTGNAP